MKSNVENSSVIRVLIGGAAIFMIVFGMKYASSILSPILLAVPLTMIVKDVVLDAYDDTRGLADLMSAY